MPTRSPGRPLSLATLVVAASGYAVTVLAGHALTPEDYQRFTIYWGLFFACTGVLDGLMHETARAVTAAHAHGAHSAHSAYSEKTPTPAHPLILTIGIAIATATLVLGSSPWWSSDLLPESATPGVPLLAAGLASYVVQATVCGLLSASHRWRSYAWLISIDSAIRVALASFALACGLPLTAFLLVTVIGAATWLALLLFDAHRWGTLIHTVADVPSGPFLRRCAAAMVASGATALFIAGFPVLLSVTATDNPAPGALAAVITAVTLSRAPLLVPLQRILPALVVRATQQRDRPLSAVGLTLLCCVIAAVIGGLVAWWLAAPVVSVFFPADLVASPGTYGVLTLASGSLAILMVTGATALGIGQHVAYVAGWLIATAVAVAVLRCGLPPVERAAIALGLAPLVGAGVQLASVLHTRPAR